jgi:type II secretory pathway pseudopilin PulG
MKTFRASSPTAPPRGEDAFSLVEVTVAIGIFAFVIVAIMGLFPAALRQKADAALETRSVMIAQQIIGGIRAGGSVSNALSSDYSIKWGENKNPSVRDLTRGLVLGFSRDGTTVNHIWDGTAAWENTDVGPAGQSITTKAFVSADNVAPGLYDVSVQVGYPANLPADKRRVQRFRTLVSSP